MPARARPQIAVDLIDTAVPARPWSAAGSRARRDGRFPFVLHLHGAPGNDARRPATMKPQRRTSGVSRQLRHQRRLRALGLCIICGAPAAQRIRKKDMRRVYASRCPTCLEAQRAYYVKKKQRSARRAAKPG
jgi:hypothetical protein